MGDCGKPIGDGLDWRLGCGWRRGKKEVLICTFWLCPWSWTFHHFAIFNPYSERRQKECSLSFLDGGGGATTVIDDRCEIQNLPSI